ncbi:hypothetical protein H4R18_001532 [Coemansia javaensis]|uniref:Zinc/iron permease n=1 Tax=Coemansia javaensis TaxID=2761396 RepID=A0A9W8LJ34_9FUNG|nr:hypothetical protein H4R18_001532 [Coemansia javaensis]
MEPLCDASDGRTAWNKDAHIVALFAIIGTSAAGVFLPIIWQTVRGLSPVRMPVLPIQVGQFFGAGVIIATGLLHLLPAANSALSNPCLVGFADRYGAWACLIALAAMFSMHSVEWWLVEAWASRTGPAAEGDDAARRALMIPGGIDNCDSDAPDNDDDDDDGDGDDEDDGMIFPEHSRRQHAAAALSPAVNPFVFGTSTVSRSTRAGLAYSTHTSGNGGFALSKYGNYAAVVQSRQQLALAQSGSRQLYSDPQFPQYAPSVAWPMPPIVAGLPACGYSQAKSTPELMRARPAKSARVSTNPPSTTSGSYEKQTGSSNAVSLRPESFSNAAGAGRKRKAALRQSATGALWKQRCLSMPRLPPTTLDAGLCDSLLEPLPPLPAAAKRARSGAVGSRASWARHKSASPQSVGRTRSRASPRPISSVLAATKRLSLQATAALAAHRNSSSSNPSAKLDTVFEAADDSAGPQCRASEDAFVSATSAMPPPSSAYQTFHTPAQSRVRAAPSSGLLRSPGTVPSFGPGPGLLSSHQMLQARLTDSGCLPPASADRNTRYSPTASDADGGSTAIHSHASSLRLSVPLEVRRRALATYVLELGIALYSVLVGLALAMSDAGFLALFIATCFHQFFEGLALGTSLAELYWIKAQLAAHYRCHLEANPEGSGLLVEPPTLTDAPPAHHAVDIADPRPATSDCDSNVARAGPSSAADSHDFVHVMAHHYQLNRDQNRRSKSRRTLTSMATSFVPEPWLVNPQLERTLGPQQQQQQQQRIASTTQPPVDNKKSDSPGLPRYLVPRNRPERMPGWWKAWVSALAFTMTTPVGIIIGLALRNVYEPHSRYALLLNGVLQSICTGVLIYVGLVTLIFGGFNSARVKQMRRLAQAMLFVAVYAGAAAMACIKIWL